jgi:hypothetical protein
MSEFVTATRKNIERHTALKGSRILLVGLGLGIGFGVIAESHTNEVASGKATTAKTCLETAPHEETITKELLSCMRDGVPGGSKANPDELNEGQPIEFIDAYIDAQNEEAKQLELGRIAAWGVSPFVVAAGLTFIDF